MALIKCEECGHMISDKATECPKCGCPIEKKVEETIVCEECGAEITPDMDECPNCGCPLHANEIIEEAATEERDESKSHRKRNIIIAAAVLVVVIGCGAWLYLSKSKEKIVKITPEFCEAIKDYSYLSEFHNGLAAVEKKFDDKWGFIDTKGKLVIPCQLATPYGDERQHEYRFYYSEGLIGVTNGEDYDNERYGFINKKSKQVIPMIYSDISNFSEGLAAVQEPASRKWGFINKKGDVVIPCKYYEVCDFSEGLAAVQDPTTEKWGFINKKGDVVIPCKYYEVGKFSEGLAAVAEEKEGNIDFIGKSGNVWTNLSNRFGRVKKTYGDYSYSEPLSTVKFDKGLCNVSNSSRENVWIDKYGKVVRDTLRNKYNKFELSEKSVGEIFEGGYVVPTKYGYKDSEGQIVVPAKYYYLGEFSNGVAVVEICNNYGCEADKHYMCGYVDKYGNDTFTTEDWNNITLLNNDIEQRRQETEKQIAEERRQREIENMKSWMKGEWVFRTSIGEARVFISDYTVKVFMLGKLEYDNYYEIKDNRLVENSGDFIMLIDESHHLLRDLDGTPYKKVSGNSSSSSYGSAISGNSYDTTFHSPMSVISYTNLKTFYCGSTSLQLTPQGLYINGNCISGAPQVVSFTSDYALVRVNSIGATITLHIYPKRGMITDGTDTYYYKHR